MVDSKYTPLMLGDEFPNLEVKTQIGTFKLHDYMGNGWLIFFSHPKDFTPVCTTELGRVAKLLPEFAKRNTKVIALSGDSVEDHVNWIKDINDTQKCEVTYPIVGDEKLETARRLGMVHDNCEKNITVRSVFIVGADRKVKLIITYPPSTGRNFDEVLRCLDSLQLTAEKKVATPENWKHGDRCVILPTVNNEDAKKQFTQEWEEVRPYLRLVDVQK